MEIKFKRFGKNKQKNFICQRYAIQESLKPPMAHSDSNALIQLYIEMLINGKGESKS